MPPPDGKILRPSIQRPNNVGNIRAGEIAAAMQSGDLTQALSLLSTANRASTNVDIDAFNALLNHAIKKNDVDVIEKSREVLTSLGAKSLLTYNLLFYYYAESKNVSSFIELYSEFHRKWQSKELQPSFQTIQIISRFFAAIQRPDLLKTVIFSLFRTENVEMKAWELLVAVTARFGQMDLLDKIFTYLKKNTLIPSIDSLRHYSSAFIILADAQPRLFEPVASAFEIQSTYDPDKGTVALYPHFIMRYLNICIVIELDINVTSDDQHSGASIDRPDVELLSEKRVDKFIAFAESFNLTITSDIWNNILYYLARMRCFEKFTVLLANAQDKGVKGENGFEFALNPLGLAAVIITTANSTNRPFEQLAKALERMGHEADKLLASKGKEDSRSNNSLTLYLALLYAQCRIHNAEGAKLVLKTLYDHDINIRTPRVFERLVRDLQNDLEALRVLYQVTDIQLLQTQRNSELFAGAYLFDAVKKGLIQFNEPNGNRVRQFVEETIDTLTTQLHLPFYASIYTEFARMFALQHNLAATTSILDMAAAAQSEVKSLDPASLKATALFHWKLRIIAASTTSTIDQATQLIEDMKQSGMHLFAVVYY